MPALKLRKSKSQYDIRPPMSKPNLNDLVSGQRLNINSKLRYDIHININLHSMLSEVQHMDESMTENTPVVTVEPILTNNNNVNQVNVDINIDVKPNTLNMDTGMNMHSTFGSSKGKKM